MRSCEADDPQRRLDVLAPLGARERRQEQRQLDVAVRGEHRDQVVGLEHEADVARAPRRELAARHRGDLVARHGHGAGRRDVQPAQEVQQRRLARAARAHERDELAGVHVQVQALEDVDLLAAAPVALVEAAHADETLAVAVAVDSDHAAPSFLSPAALCNAGARLRAVRARRRPREGYGSACVPRRSAKVRRAPADGERPP